jgi:hypothetical protein
VRVEFGPFDVVAADGDLGAWRRLWQAATNGFVNNADYERVQGNNPDGTPNPADEVLVDMDNLIDYMLLTIYVGNFDGPVYQNNFPNNFFATRNRRTREGFRFTAHDAELSLSDVNYDRTGTITVGDPAAGSTFSESNPQYLWQRLWANAEFRLRTADHVQRHFFNGGALTPAAASRAMPRARTKSPAPWWGNPRAGATRNANRPSCARTGSMRERRDEQLPSVSFRHRAATTAQSRIIPEPHRAPVQPAARGCSVRCAAHPVPHQHGRHDLVHARRHRPSRAGRRDLVLGAILRRRPRSPGPHYCSGPGPGWRDVERAGRSDLLSPQDLTGLRVTEIMFNPPRFGAVDGDEVEFLELKNTSAVEIDLTGLAFTAGIDFTFPAHTRLASGAFFVLARNAAQFATRYPGVTFHGLYSGKLDNAGETLRLATALSNTVLSVTFDDAPPWPLAADGYGFSLVPSGAVTGDDSHPRHWRASASPGGSPGPTIRGIDPPPCPQRSDVAPDAPRPG